MLKRCCRIDCIASEGGLFVAAAGVLDGEEEEKKKMMMISNVYS